MRMKTLEPVQIPLDCVRRCWQALRQPNLAGQFIINAKSALQLAPSDIWSPEGTRGTGFAPTRSDPE